eukprot:TRINITY_DN3174_c0_g1_i1.p2 TRINITY_DN3174_c0_g1~~TRINITY_DN3174_c0_g1_i1.p2  ORF type:complete len:129 (-),score=42.85 TRINITY_DN3174_c0_g1_i1:166-552(-)
MFDVLNRDRADGIDFEEVLQFFYPNRNSAVIKAMMDSVGLGAPKPEEPKPQAITLSQEQLDEVKGIFAVYDADKSNGLDISEVRDLVQGAASMSDEEVEKLFARWDTNKDNKIDLDEFLQMMSDPNLF